MGQRMVALASTDHEVVVAAAIDAPDHPRLGEDAGLMAGVGRLGVPLLATLEAAVDVAVDFSLPAGADAILEVCRERKIPLVVATTGLSESQMERLSVAAQEIALLHSPNMSLAVNLTMKLAEAAAHALRDRDADVEIIERHHRFKEDAPSGTALRFGQIIAGVMGQSAQRHGRHGRPGKRPHQEIGYHAVRAGDNPGEHAIVFGLLGETVELSVRATGRHCYAAGALAAAKFLVGKKPGLYGIDDVLGL
jgi:4-hydroxy-tetrahydrodipicolinate reductase